MASLYEIRAELATVMNRYDFVDGACIDFETGEVIPVETVRQQVADLLMQEDEKIDNIVLYIKNLRSDAEQIDTEIKRLQERKAAKTKKADALMPLVEEACNGKKRERANYVVAVRKSESVNISIEPDKLPDEFQRIKHSVEADKVALKKAVKAGAVIEGV